MGPTLAWICAICVYLCLSASICVHLYRSSVPLISQSRNKKTNVFNPQPHSWYCQTHALTAELVNMVKGCWGHPRIWGPFQYGRWQYHFTYRSHPTSVVAEARQARVCHYLPTCQLWRTPHHRASFAWIQCMASLEGWLWEGRCIKPSQPLQ